MRGTRGRIGADSAVAVAVATKTHAAATERPTRGLNTGGDRLDTNEMNIMLGHDLAASVDSCGAVVYSFLSISNLPFHLHLAECSVAMRSLVVLYCANQQSRPRRTFRHGENQLHMFLSPNVDFRLPVCVYA
jgi:hypothetical protein